MHEALKIAATTINAAYAATADNPDAHEAIDDLRQSLANQFALSGLCSYDEFSDLARRRARVSIYLRHHRLCRSGQRDETMHDPLIKSVDGVPVDYYVAPPTEAPAESETVRSPDSIKQLISAMTFASGTKLLRLAKEDGELVGYISCADYCARQLVPGGFIVCDIDALAEKPDEPILYTLTGDVADFADAMAAEWGWTQDLKPETPAETVRSPDVQPLLDMLKRCRDQFADYARQHRGKIGTVIPLEAEHLVKATIAKAEVNEAFVAEIHALLEQTSPS